MARQVVGPFMSHPPSAAHRHTPECERLIREAALDETIAESFPASDPPSTVPNPDNHDAITPKTPEDDV
jgi:hypothetical protein